MTAERDYVPWATFQEVTGYIGSMLSGSEAYGDFKVSTYYSSILQYIKNVTSKQQRETYQFGLIKLPMH